MKRSFWILTFLGAMVFLAPPATGQDYRAKVQGAVQDSSGGTIPGAEVSLTNINTGVSATRVANDTGAYIFDFVPPGIYRLSVAMPGFKTVTQENIVVQVRGDVTVNMELPVGEISDHVTVTEHPIAVQFNTTTMDLTIDRKMLDNLPIGGRNPFQLATLNPGAINRFWSEHPSPHEMWASSSIEIGGSGQRRNDLLLDGGSVQVATKGSYSPPVDAVQEFTVQQNSVDAEFGHSGGGIISVSMKSGTNDIRGTAYYFGRNPKLNARPNSLGNVRNEVRSHIVGAAIGNPIIKNKLFTFTAYERWNTKNPALYEARLPTELERAGDFSQSLNADGSLRAVYDPWSTQFDPATNTVTRAQFPNNRIPANRIDSTAARILQDLWLPNNPGEDITGVKNYRAGYFTFGEYWNFSNRTDWAVSDRLNVFGRFSAFSNQQDQNDFTGKPRAVTNNAAGNPKSRNITTDAVYSINPSNVLNLRFAYNSLTEDYYSPKQKLAEADLAQLWPNQWFTPYSHDIPAIYYPQININGYLGFGRGLYWLQHGHNYSSTAKWATNRGRHYLKSGFEWRRNNSETQWPNLANFGFQPVDTAATFISPDLRYSGDGFASFLLGAVNSGRSTYTPPNAIITPFYGFYLQDDFKINPRVTLNLGMRYEYSGAPYDRNDLVSRYLDLANPISEMQANPPAIPADVLAMRAAPPVYNGAWIFSDDNNRGIYQTSKKSFMPRVGLAYRIDDKTALRFGYSRFIVPPLLISETLEPGAGYGWGTLPIYGFNAATNAIGPLQGIPQTVLSDPFPASSNPLILPTGKSLGRYQNLGAAAAWHQQDLRTQVNNRINVSLQHELPGRLIADATYFVNIGEDLPYTRQVNMRDPQLSLDYKGELSVSVPNPFYQYLTPETFPGQLRNQKSIAKGSLLVPYPQYGTLREMNTAGLKDRYHSLQLKLQKPFSRGYSFLFNYSHDRHETTDFYDDFDLYAFNPTWHRSVDPRHRLNFYGIWDLPFGRNRAVMNSLHPVLDAVFGGWSVSSISKMTSGRFISFGALLASGDPTLSNPTRQQWFDTSVFAPLPAYTRRSNPKTYPGLTGPGYWNIDFTLSKFFEVREEVKVEFRMEAFNLTNSIMWGLPNTSVFSSQFGMVTTQANAGRFLQYTTRIHF
jgi:hypothetical protein